MRVEEGLGCGVVWWCVGVVTKDSVEGEWVRNNWMMGVTGVLVGNLHGHKP